MAITTLSMLLTVFVLNLHHIGNRPVPHWIQNLVLVYVARIVGGYQRRVHVSKSSCRGGGAGGGATLMLRNRNVERADVEDEDDDDLDDLDEDEEAGQSFEDDSDLSG